jgi:2-polyprenyl-6-hydroxyphenyl methylase/3-demethylubiquinone-9 3-methyltransferase
MTENAAGDRDEERQRRVREMYSELRYPALDPADNDRYERHRRSVYGMLGIDPDTFFRGKMVLDAGCGTGEETMFLASLGARKIIGIDTSDGSLEYARARARDAGLDNVEFRHVSVLDTETFADASFDYVSSLGCIHHTPRMQDAFDNLCRMLRPGGHLCTFIYNSYGHFFYNFECDFLDRFIGDDVEQRVRFARRWFDWRGGSTFQREGVTSSADHRLYDKYGVLYRDSLTLGELLRWYEENGITQQASFPMAMRDMLSAYEAHSGGDGSGLKRIIAGVASGLLPGPPGSRKWRWVNRRYMEGLLLVMGLYDYGSAFRVLGQKGPAG